MKLKELYIKNFRGIPKELVLRFYTPLNTSPHSLVVFGDNGSGKSSIVDAVEFALQARIMRSKRLGFKQYASPVSYATKSNPTIRATLSDNSSVERHIFRGPGDLWESDPAPLPKFSFSPIVLRRTDILRFYDTPEPERQLIFMDFMQTPGEGWKSIRREDVDEVNTHRLGLRKHRNELRARLAAVLEMDVNDLPRSPDALLRRVYSKFFGSIPDEDWVGYRLDDLKGYIEDEIFDLVKTLFSAIVDYRDAQVAYEKLKLLPSQTMALNTIPEVLGTLGEGITTAFNRITRNTFVDSISLVIGNLCQTSLSLKVRLKNGLTCEPQHIFSEANLDLLAFLVYVSIVKESARRGQGKVFVLDDVFQSVDSTIRTNTFDYIVSELQDWQLIITVHDRLWLAQVKDILRRYSVSFLEHQIVRWRFEMGPDFLDSDRDTESSLIEAMTVGDIVAICSHAGLVLEEVSNRLSWTLPTAVTRRKEDKYTLGDLWPGVYKALKKTSVKDVALDIDRHIQLRNLVGAHFNEWARNLSVHEADEFGQAVLSLLRQVRCDMCHTWIESVSQKNNKWTCRCGKTEL